MCDIVAQSIIFSLINGIFNYGAVYLLCSGDDTTRSSYCPAPEDVNVMNFIYGFIAMFILYFVVSWISTSLFGDNDLIKIILLTLIAVFGVIFYMNYIGRNQDLSLVSIIIMFIIAFVIFWIIEKLTDFIGLGICGTNVQTVNTTFYPTVRY